MLDQAEINIKIFISTPLRDTPRTLYEGLYHLHQTLFKR